MLFSGPNLGSRFLLSQNAALIAAFFILYFLKQSSKESRAARKNVAKSPSNDGTESEGNAQAFRKEKARTTQQSTERNKKPEICTYEEDTFMTKLFAAHLAQERPSTFIEGAYDPEQELWVGNNQLQGANPQTTGTDTLTIGGGTTTLAANAADTDFLFDNDRDADL